MKVLITGIGVTGKSTLRRLLVAKLRSFNLLAEHFDADKFKELRDIKDVDCLEALPDVFLDNVVYVIEDIRGPLSSATLPLEHYNLIIYVQPDIFSHIMYWISRSWQWFGVGQFSWTPEKGWLGTGKPCDIHNVGSIFKTIGRDFKNRKRWMAEDLNAINQFSHLVIRSRWSYSGPRFYLVLP